MSNSIPIMHHTSYGNPIVKGGLSQVYIGKYCSISDFSTFDCGFQHNADFISCYPFNQKMGIDNSLHPKTNGDIRIGSDVWVAENAVVMSGVTIGDGAIIGHSAVVTKNVPAYAVMGGVPAEVKRFRFTPIQIEKLLQLKWWDLPEEKIREIAPLLMSNNIDGLFNHFGI